MAGLYRYKDDASVIGQIRCMPGTHHPVRIGKLWLILMQSWEDLGHQAPYFDLRVINFPTPFPALPWSGFQGENYGFPLIRVDPQIDSLSAQ